MTSVGTKIGVFLGMMVIFASINVGVVYHYQSQVSTVSKSVDYAARSACSVSGWPGLPTTTRRWSLGMPPRYSGWR